jgi:hypothetical protein
MGGPAHRLDSTWLIPPTEGMLQPLLAITVLGDDDCRSFTAILNTYIARWEDALGVSGRSAELRTHDLAAGEDRCLLVLILMNQTPEVIAEAAAIVDGAAKRGFLGVATAALGKQPAPALKQIAERCAMAIITADAELLLHPIRMLAGYNPIIGYDFVDLKTLYAGRLAEVRRGRFGAGAQPPVDIAESINVTGFCCLMLSNADRSLAMIDAIVAPLLEHVGDGVVAVNGHWEAEDYIEWAIIRGPKPE